MAAKSRSPGRWGWPERGDDRRRCRSPRRLRLGRTGRSSALRRDNHSWLVKTAFGRRAADAVEIERIEGAGPQGSSSRVTTRPARGPALMVHARLLRICSSPAIGVQGAPYSSGGRGQAPVSLTVYSDGTPRMSLRKTLITIKRHSNMDACQ